MLKVITLNRKQTFTKYLTKKGKQESSEKKINLLLLQLKKQLFLPPELCLNQSLDNHKIRLSMGYALNILAHHKQIKHGIRLLSFKNNLTDNIIDGLTHTGKSFNQKKKMYSEANQFRFTRKRSRKK